MQYTETSVFLDGLEFIGRHGVHRHEHEMDQRFAVSLRIHGDFSRAMVEDDIAGTVNYSTVYQIVEQTMEGTSCLLIEKLAQAIGENIFHEFPHVQKIEIIMQKFPASFANKTYGSIGFSATISR
jgi:dihydroneopterin aldolase